MAHIDIMDGHFVPNLTFGAPVIAALRAHTKLEFDVHLMVTNPEDYIEPFAEDGADWITFSRRSGAACTESSNKSERNQSGHCAESGNTAERGKRKCCRIWTWC